MSWSIADIPSQEGRVAVVTGANGGLGLATTRALAGAGAHVVMAARNQDKAEMARRQVLAFHPHASLEIVPLDLGSLDAIAQAAATIRERHERIDLLINNAGLMAMPERRTVDGFEMQFGVNHLGHWALTSHLLPAIVATPGARVVTVSSSAQHIGRRIDPGNPHLRGNYGPWKAYGQAKLANRHFAVGLQRRFARAEVDAKSLSAHPGFSNTDLQSRTIREDGGGWIATLSRRGVAATGMMPDEGALSQLRAATDPTAEGGAFYGPVWGATGPPVAKPLVRPRADKAITTLWAVSERETGLAIDVDAARQIS